MTHQMRWTKLLVMGAISFGAMYGLMYVMVDRFANIYPSLNQFYMASLMTAAMMLIEIWIMRSMYSYQVKMIIGSLSVLALIVFYLAIRSQTAISDREFLKSMISHHGSAILMCEQAKLNDPEIKKLCRDILSSQQSQIDWMRAKLSK